MQREGGVLGADLHGALHARGIDVERLKIDDRGSVVPPRSSLPSDVEALVADLPVLLSTDPQMHQLDVGSLIGTGGMGEVRVADQLALKRQVAVKLQALNSASPATTLQLLREARVTGMLEHPNIVPIHALGRDAAGRPHIVMKRIEGEAWSAAITERPAVVSEVNLAFHLGVLLQVIRALDFAHSRGVLHLDVKPDNVMIGSFGEVYLVDWGVAVRTREDLGHPDIPLAASVEYVIGTPQYMPPEVVAAAGELLSPQTDVYLVGGCLHQILTGEAPHDGASLREVFDCAFVSDPKDYDDRWPRELIQIARRAMHREQRERFPDVDNVRHAIETFLQHRHGRALSREARALLRQLEERMGALDDGELDAASRREMHDRFSACRFRYELALREWPDDARAKRGLQRALERMIEFELRYGAAQVALNHLADLPDDNEALRRRVEEGLRYEAAKGVALERLQRDADVTVGDRTRGVVALATGIVWGALHIAIGRSELDPSAFWMCLLGTAFVVVSLTVVAIGRRVFLNTPANTRTSIAFVAGFASYSTVWLLASHIPLSAAWALALVQVPALAMWSTLALGSDSRLLPLPAAQASTLFAIVVLPAYAFELVGAASFIGPIAVALMWLRHKR